MLIIFISFSLTKLFLDHKWQRKERRNKDNNNKVEKRNNKLVGGIYSVIF